MANDAKLISNEVLKPVYDNLNGKIGDLKSATYNIWTGDPSYTFTRYTTISGLNIPAGTYTFSAFITSSDTDGTKSRVLFRHEGSQLTYTTLERNEQVYFNVTFASSCDEILIYAGETSNASANDTATWANVMIYSGSDEKLYLPNVSAADYVARNEIAEITYAPTLIDISGKSLANTAIWEAGSINTSGKNATNSYSIRTINYIKVDATKKLYFQAYYELPSTLVDVEDTDNDNMRNAYFHQYDAKGKWISYITFTSSETLHGKEVSLASSCAYIRIQIYTKLTNTTIADIMPETIFIDQVNGDDWLPPYYDTYLATKAAAIETYARDAAGDGNVFIFITDEHAPTYNAMRSPQIINRLSKLTHLPILFSGGDVTQDGQNTYIYCNALRENYSGAIHHLVGNHDFMNLNTGTSLYYDMDMYNTDQIGSGEHHYYYVDDPQRMTRYICLAAYMESESALGTGSGVSAQGGYTQEQIDWINNVALDIPTGWDIIVFTHYFYTINTSTKVATLSYGSSILQSLVANGHVIAVFQGHTHNDRIIKGHDSAAGDLPIIITTCDKNVEYQDNEGWTINRATGTIYEQALDVAIVNKKTKTINIVRIGALAENGVNDSVGTTAEERTVTYGS